MWHDGWVWLRSCPRLEILSTNGRISCRIHKCTLPKARRFRTCWLAALRIKDNCCDVRWCCWKVRQKKNRRVRRQAKMSRLKRRCKHLPKEELSPHLLKFKMQRAWAQKLWKKHQFLLSRTWKAHLSSKMKERCPFSKTRPIQASQRHSTVRRSAQLKNRNRWLIPLERNPVRNRNESEVAAHRSALARTNYHFSAATFKGCPLDED